MYRTDYPGPAVTGVAAFKAALTQISLRNVQTTAFTPRSLTTNVMDDDVLASTRHREVVGSPFDHRYRDIEAQLPVTCGHHAEVWRPDERFAKI